MYCVYLCKKARNSFSRYRNAKNIMKCERTQPETSGFIYKALRAVSFHGTMYMYRQSSDVWTEKKRKDHPYTCIHEHVGLQKWCTMYNMYRNTKNIFKCEYTQPKTSGSFTKLYMYSTLQYHFMLDRAQTFELKWKGQPYISRWFSLP